MGLSTPSSSINSLYILGLSPRSLSALRLRGCAKASKILSPMGRRTRREINRFVKPPQQTAGALGGPL